MFELIELEQIKTPELFSKDSAERLVKEIEDKVSGLVFDISTKKGQDECRSVAAKIASRKTAVEKYKLECTEGLRARTSEINQWGKFLNTKIQELQDAVRKPLTEFEEAEKKRLAEREERIAQLNNFYNIAIHNVADAQKFLHDLTTLEQFDWHEDFELRAKEIAERARKYLEEKLAQEVKREADQKELDELRAFQAQKQKEENERAQKEREQKIAEEATKRAEESKQLEIEAAIKKEKDRAEAERIREEAELAKREADKKHRARIENEAAKALCEEVFGGENAEGSEWVNDIIAKIAQGKIPHIQIKY